MDRLAFVLVFTMLAIFANYRLARIIASDEITRPLAARIGMKAAGKPAYSPWWILAGITSCPQCAGVWLAFLIVFAAKPQSVVELGLIWWAIAGGQVFMENMS